MDFQFSANFAYMNTKCSSANLIPFFSYSPSSTSTKTTKLSFSALAACVSGAHVIRNGNMKTSEFHILPSGARINIPRKTSFSSLSRSHRRSAIFRTEWQSHFFNKSSFCVYPLDAVLFFVWNVSVLVSTL